jgi:hypothetical protein
MLLLFAFKSGVTQIQQTRKYSVSIQPSSGVYQTKLLRYVGFLPGSPDANFIGFEAGLTSSIKWNIGAINLGFGMGLNNKFTAYEGLNTVIPSFFGTVDLGKNDEFNKISVILSSGVIQGTLENKYKLFISLGPKINLSRSYKKVSFSIHPSVLIQQFEKKVLIHRYIGSSSSTQEYEGTLSTVGGYLAIVIEFNKLKTQNITNE